MNPQRAKVPKPSELLKAPRYCVRQVARLVDLHPQTAYRWLNGYSYQRSSQGEKQKVARSPLLKSRLRRDSSEVSFLELIETFFVVHLRHSVGMSLARIEKLLGIASADLGTAFPFSWAWKELYINKESAYFRWLHEDEEEFVDLLSGNGCFLHPLLSCRDSNSD